MRAAEAIEPQLERRVRPEERPNSHPENDPRCSPNGEGGHPSVAYKRAHAEGECCHHRSAKRAANVVHLLERLAWDATQNLGRLRLERLDATSNVRSANQRDDHREAERRVVDDDYHTALFPRRRFAHQYRAAGWRPRVELRHERPDDNPESTTAGQVGEYALAERPQVKSHTGPLAVARSPSDSCLLSRHRAQDMDESRSRTGRRPLEVLIKGPGRDKACPARACSSPARPARHRS